jgi:hypothetical protein
MELDSNKYYDYIKFFQFLATKCSDCPDFHN